MSTNEQQMAKVPKMHFRQTQTLAYDVFVQLGPNHFVVIGKAGTASQMHRLKAFESEMIPWFYLLPQDYPVYLNQTLDQATRAAKSAGSSRVELWTATSQSLAAVLEFTRVGGFTPKTWEATRRISQMVLDVALTRPAMATLLNEMLALDELQTRHHMGVALFSVLLGREVGVSTEGLLNLTSAALVHDIGLMKLSDEVTHKKEDLLTPDERQSYETHPLLGANILKNCSQVPIDVVTLVLEHHENAIGSGYPRKLKADQMQKASMVLALCERFCELTIGDTLHWDFLTPQAAVNTITNVEGHPYPADLMKFLERHLRRGAAQN